LLTKETPSITTVNYNAKAYAEKYDPGAETTRLLMNEYDAIAD